MFGWEKKIHDTHSLNPQRMSFSYRGGGRDEEAHEIKLIYASFILFTQLNLLFYIKIN